MPGKLRTMSIGGRKRLVYRRSDGKYKVGKHRYAARKPSLDRKIHAKRKAYVPKKGSKGRYAHAGDYNTRKKTTKGGAKGWW